ncbi:arginine-trna-protein transferase 1 [Ophiostoma piceae UAMH 11346]|uniref:arginyltransferase n=1 Tax=Ophiostoma piceae (strain UAMH 11346) TaxID=1262450 RepID=S3C3C8_OPHP1|nr:arginine-trna-protein transferase 1 [Ophiostoma piceae UAMH 11346]
MALPFSETADDPYSYLVPMGYMNSSSCGYCCKTVDDKGKPIRRLMFYATTKSLKPEFYQTLVDRCWRRSGKLVYRPNQREACCPHYTIRLDASAYRPTRDHRQTVNRFSRYVVGDEYTKTAQRVRPLSREEAKRRDTTFDLSERLHEVESCNLPSLQASRTRHRSKSKPAGTEGSEPDSLPPPKTIDPAHRFEVTLEPDTYTDEKYEIYANYQRIIHKEPDSKISKPTFTSFLCNSSLRRETEIERDESGGIREKKLGSYHQCYRLDGRLVAVGVLDLLPHCVSAVYFMYHESIHEFNPGKLSAMREIALAIEGGYKWWYSGFYIASCPKMRYKLGFMPQYVLDPETYQWDAFDKKSQELYVRQPYVSLSRERRLLERAAEEDGKEETDAKEEKNKQEEKKEKAGMDDNSTAEDDSFSDEDDVILPLLRSNMPGLPTLEQVSEYKLGHIPILTSHEPEPFPAFYLASWAGSSFTDNASIKSRLAELVAMIGEDLAPNICLDFRKQ